jgi:hypothetical protein
MSNVNRVLVHAKNSEYLFYVPCFNAVSKHETAVTIYQRPHDGFQPVGAETVLEFDTDEEANAVYTALREAWFAYIRRNFEPYLVEAGGGGPSKRETADASQEPEGDLDDDGEEEEEAVAVPPNTSQDPDRKKEDDEKEFSFETMD